MQILRKVYNPHCESTSTGAIIIHFICQLSWTGNLKWKETIYDTIVVCYNFPDPIRQGFITKHHNLGDKFKQEGRDTAILLESLSTIFTPNKLYWNVHMNAKIFIAEIVLQYYERPVPGESSRPGSSCVCAVTRLITKSPRTLRFGSQWHPGDHLIPSTAAGMALTHSSEWRGKMV